MTCQNRGGGGGRRKKSLSLLRSKRTSSSFLPFRERDPFAAFFFYRSPLLLDLFAESKPPSSPPPPLCLPPPIGKIPRVILVRSRGERENNEAGLKGILFFPSLKESAKFAQEGNLPAGCPTNVGTPPEPHQRAALCW